MKQHNTCTHTHTQTFLHTYLFIITITRHSVPHKCTLTNLCFTAIEGALNEERKKEKNERKQKQKQIKWN